MSSHHHTHTTYTGTLSFSTQIDNHQITTDSGTENGGQNLGPSPKKLMLASLAGCTGIDIALILNKMQVPFKDLSIDVEAELTSAQPAIYQWVHIIYHISLSPQNQHKMHRAVLLSEEKYCAVMHMFRKFAKVTHEVRFLPW